jgi:hypothetical protein
MYDTIEQLRTRIESRRMTLDASDLFALLAAEACSQCCTNSDGGNGSCPPPKKIAE